MFMAAAAALLAACVTAPKAPLVPLVAPRPPPPSYLDQWVSYPELEVLHVKNVHAYRGKPVCQACHQTKSAQLLKDPVATCSGCHQGQHTPGHESGSVLKRRFEVKLPLWDGKIACHTCHDSHDVKRELHGLRKSFNKLCLDCHPGY